MVLLTSTLSYNSTMPISKALSWHSAASFEQPTKLNHQKDIQYLAKFGTRHLWNILPHVSD
jgi:hypothetical protein